MENNPYTSYLQNMLRSTVSDENGEYPKGFSPTKDLTNASMDIGSIMESADNLDKLYEADKYNQSIGVEERYFKGDDFLEQPLVINSRVTYEGLSENLDSSKKDLLGKLLGNLTDNDFTPNVEETLRNSGIESFEDSVLQDYNEEIVESGVLEALTQTTEGEDEDSPYEGPDEDDEVAEEYDDLDGYDELDDEEDFEDLEDSEETETTDYEGLDDYDDLEDDEDEEDEEYEEDSDGYAEDDSWMDEDEDEEYEEEDDEYSEDDSWMDEDEDEEFDEVDEEEDDEDSWMDEDEDEETDLEDTSWGSDEDEDDNPWATLEQDAQSVQEESSKPEVELDEFGLPKLAGTGKQFVETNWGDKEESDKDVFGTTDSVSSSPFSESVSNDSWGTETSSVAFNNEPESPVEQVLKPIDESLVQVIEGISGGILKTPTKLAGMFLKKKK